MNWQCLITAFLAYIECAGGFSNSAKNAKVQDCLIHAASVGAAAAIPAFFECMAKSNGNGNGGDGGNDPGFNPGDRTRCPQAGSSPTG